MILLFLNAIRSTVMLCFSKRPLESSPAREIYRVSIRKRAHILEAKLGKILFTQACVNRILFFY